MSLGKQSTTQRVELRGPREKGKHEGDKGDRSLWLREQISHNKKQKPSVLVGEPLGIHWLSSTQTFPKSSLSLSTTSFTATQTMQAVHQLPPQMFSHYPRQSLNGVHSNAAGPSVMPTPPVTTRKRKRAHQYTVSYSEVQEVDSDGKLREVIVIEDTPPPPTISPVTTHTGAYSASYQPPIYSAPIRTRARAAAEAQALSASTSSAIIAPAPKKRKRDHLEEVRVPPPKKATLIQQSQALPQTKSWDSRSAAATDDVGTCLWMPVNDYVLMPFLSDQTSKGPVSCDDKEGHYIIIPDDLIYRRCKLLVH